MIFKTPKFPRWVSPTLKNLINRKNVLIQFLNKRVVLSITYYSPSFELNVNVYLSQIIDLLLVSMNPTFPLKQYSEIPFSVHFSNKVANRPLSTVNFFSKLFSSVFNPPLAPFLNVNLDIKLSYD